MNKIYQKRTCPICQKCGNRKFKVLKHEQKGNVKHKVKIQCLNCESITVLI